MVIIPPALQEIMLLNLINSKRHTILQHGHITSYILEQLYQAVSWLFPEGDHLIEV